jgi:hypothetical protein
MNNNQQVERQVHQLFRHTVDSLEHMNNKDLTAILSMAKIDKTARETKLRRKWPEFITYLLKCFWIKTQIVG